MVRRITGYQAGLLSILVCWLSIGYGKGKLPATLLAPHAAPEEAASPLPSIDTAMAAATSFLSANQSHDGAWRSDVYAPFKAGDALTPLVLLALAEMPATEATAAIERAVRYLVEIVPRDDDLVKDERHELAYPVYTAACAVIVLSARSDPQSQAARDAWLDDLRNRQMTESLGWQPSDARYGGWGYAIALPLKPAEGEPLAPLAEPNLSATVFALAALRAAGVACDAAEVRRALQFVRRCQNFTDDPSTLDPRFDDGGFCFMHDDPVRNKAGLVGSDAAHRERYASYGSATADGLRALFLCGLLSDTPRVAAASNWLKRPFSAATHPGRYAAPRESARESVYFYYCHSLAELLADRAVANLDAADRVRWAEAVIAELLRRQQPDGSWVNAAVDAREDDPLVATAFALRALALCRRVIVVESSATPRGMLHDERTDRSNSIPDASR